MATGVGELGPRNEVGGEGPRDGTHAGQARIQWPWPETEDTLGVTCDPPGRAACGHHLPAPPEAGSCRERERRVGPEPAPGASARVLTCGAASSSGRRSLRPCAHSAVILVPRTGSGAQGRAATDTSGDPWGEQGRGPEAAGRRRAQGGLQGSGPRPASAVVPTAVPTLSLPWPPGTPLPGSDASGSTTCWPEAPSRDPRPAGQGSPARPSDPRAEGKGRPGVHEVPWPVASGQVSHLCDLGVCSRHLSIRRTGCRSRRPAQAPVPTHQHLREHQGSQRPAMHSRVPDQHVQPLGLCEAGHVQHHSTCGRRAVSTGQPAQGVCVVWGPAPGGVLEDGQTQRQDTGDGCEATRRQSVARPRPFPRRPSPPRLGDVPSRTEDIGKCSGPTEDRRPVALPSHPQEA